MASGKGCKYFQKDNYCRLVPGTSAVDKNCVFHENRCLTEAEYTKKTGQKPPLPTLQPGIIAPIPLKEIQMVKEGLSYLQGPISYSIFNIPEGFLTSKRTSRIPPKRFHFFGDAHFSKEGGCPMSCSRLDENGNVVDVSEQCYDITYLLKKLFDEGANKKTYTDFFLEIPFRVPTLATDEIDEIVAQFKRKATLKPIRPTKRGEGDIVDELIIKMREKKTFAELDYITTIQAIFSDCFQREKEYCSYSPYTRFHYADVRLTHQEEFEGAVTLNTYLFIERISAIFFRLDILLKFESQVPLEILVTLPQVIDIKNQIIAMADFTNALIEKVLMKGYTISGNVIDYNKEFFETVLTSDDYEKDLNRIFDLMISDLPLTVPLTERSNFERLRSALLAISTVRNGKHMHRTRAQLYELDQEGITYRGHPMSQLILSFLRQKYQESNLSAAYSYWRNFYQNVIQPLKKPKEFSKALDAYRKVMSEQTREAIVTSILLSSDALIMDGYLLGRMFRVFDGKNLGEMDIVYAGDAHISNYKRFFREMLQLDPLLEKSEQITSFVPSRIKRCLRVPDMEKYIH